MAIGRETSTRSTHISPVDLVGIDVSTASTGIAPELNPRSGFSFGRQPTTGPVGSLVDADARRDDRLRRRWRAIVPDVGTGAVHRHADAQVSAQLGRAVGQPPIDSFTDQRTKEHRLTVTLVPRDDVDAVVHPVDEVHVEMARRAEHHLVASRPSAIAVTGRIVLRVRLDFDDPAAPAADDDDLVQQIWSDVGRVALEVRLWQSSSHETAERSRSTCAANRSSWTATASGPAPPAVTLRFTATPGATSAAASRPSIGSASTSARSEPSPDTERRTRFPTIACASRNGVPRSTSHSARSVADVDSASAAAFMRSGTHVTVAIIPVTAPRASRTWSTESNNGSLSSW